MHIPASATSPAMPYTGATDRPWNAHSEIASWLTESSVGHVESQTASSRSSTTHEITALSAATFTLIATRSSELNGRTATNEGTARSSVQNTGLQKATPTGTARTIGEASATSSR